MSAVDVLIKGGSAKDVKIICVVVMFGLEIFSVGPAGKMMVKNFYFFFVDLCEPPGVFNRFTVINIPGHKKKKKGNKKDRYHQSKHPVQ